MARALRQIETCDDCTRHGITDVPADYTHVIAIDDGPLKAIDLCARSEVEFQCIADLYARAREIQQLPTPRPAKEPAHLSREDEPKQLAPAPAQEPAPDTVTTSRPKKRAKTAPTAADTRDKETASGPPPKKKKLDDQEKRAEGAVWCPEPHPTRHGAGMWVTVGGGQGSHARECHGHAKLWDIAWEDRDSILSVPCTAHARCKEIKLAFRTKQGLRQHIIACPLPRIDLDGAQPIQEDIGA